MTILLTFANSAKSPLASLTEEDRLVYQTLSQRASEEEGWHIQHNSHATIREVVEDLDLYKQKISVFLFSGHAERDQLFTTDEAAKADGIAALLGECPNLKLAVLNGCSTNGQVEGLLAVGVPCVIATSSPVSDAAATQFSITFFQAMGKDGKSIRQAFDIALKVAKVYAKNEIKVQRGILKVKEIDEPVWGIFYPNGQEINLEWTLNAEPKVDASFIPNELLLAKAWEAIAPFVSQKDRKYTKLDKIDQIITELPHPISEYLRKLIAKSRQGEKVEVFYNDFSTNRLNYLIYTYITCIELVTFTLLAQVWDELNKGNIQQLADDLTEQLAIFFALTNREKKKHSYLPIIQKTVAFLKAKEISFFIKEYEDLSVAFQEGTDFFLACTAIEAIQREYFLADKMSDSVARQLCIQLEKQLSTIINHLGFLAKYKMTSMKDIHFIKLKHQMKPKYLLNFVELRYRPAGMDVVSETLTDFMDNASVILLNEKVDGVTYLNLSPFIFDQNSFDEKAKLANLCVYQTFEKSAEAFTFRYIYKPTSRPLIIGKGIDYFKDISAQFNAFYSLIFNKKLTNYDATAA